MKTNSITLLVFFLLSTFFIQAQLEVTSFTLINAESNADITTITPNAQINLEDIQNSGINVRANVGNQTPGSVILTLSGPVQNTRTENTAPYALFGDVAGNYDIFFLPAGDYTLFATPFSSTNGNGAEGTSLSVNFSIVEPVNNQAPNAVASANPISGIAPLPVTFNGNASTDDLAISSYNWNFGDGTTGTGANVTHTYANPGTYIATLTVTDAEGLQDTDTILITASDTPDTVLTPLFRVNAGGNTLSFEGDVFSADQNFENGRVFENPLAQLPALYQTERSSLTRAFSYNFAVPDGTYTVVLHFAELFFGTTGGGAGGPGLRVFDVIMEGDTVLDNYDIYLDVGPEAIAVQTFEVTVQDGELNIDFSGLASVGGVEQPKVSAIEVFSNDSSATALPTAVASATPISGQAPLEVNFTGSNSTDEDGIAAYFWNFDDGSTSTEANPTHTFVEPGIYDVSLTVSNTQNLQNSTSLSIVVTNPDGVSILGELEQWHTVTLLFDGPTVSENSIATFLRHRLNVTFTGPNGEQFIVPGYFAADGNAAETGATSGNQWATKFTPNQTGQWTFEASFRQGSNLAINTNPNAGNPISFDGTTGAFTISPSSKSLPDNRAQGRLNYVDENYLQYEGTGNYFIKAGSDSPENLLSFTDFDNTVASKTWSPHVGDWNPGDPLWRGDLGRGIIGAVNYLADQGMNSISFLPMNVIGDGRDVWPWVAPVHSALDDPSDTDTANRRRYDVSKLAQWDIVFQHASNRGMFLHFKTQEEENDQLMDSGSLGISRRLYYRELIARFGHHLALNWNVGEENTQSPQQRIEVAQYISDIDPYNHHIVLHTFPDQQQNVYPALLGNASAYSGASLQSPITRVHDDVRQWVSESNASGRPWAVANDEQGPFLIGVATDAAYTGNRGTVADNREEIRHLVLWGTLMAGGYGVEYYFGGDTGESDLDAEDLRSRATKWNDARHALTFFRNYLPFWQMENQNELTSNTEDYCFAQGGEVYAIYLPQGESTTLNLSNQQGTYSVQWFDPINGGALQSGTVSTIAGGATRALGNPNSGAVQDWVALIQRNGGAPTAAINATPISGLAPLEVDFSSDGSQSSNGGDLTYFWNFDDGATSSEANPTHIFTEEGIYNVTLTVTDTEGLTSTNTIQITVSPAITWIDLDDTENYTARHENGFVQVGNRFYLLGGRETNNVDIYDYTTNTWSTAAVPAPVNLSHFQAVVHEGLIWVLSALEDDNFPADIAASHIWIFNPSTEEWIEGSEIPENRRRGAAGAVVYNNRFYIAGGNINGHDGGFVPWFDEYDPVTGIWTPLADAPIARDHFQATIVGDALYLIGGRQSGGNDGPFSPGIAQVDVFDFANNQWSTLGASANIPLPRPGAMTANFNDRIVVFGGALRNQTIDGQFVTNAVTSLTQEFDPTTESWTRLEDANFGRRASQAIVSGSGIFVAAGSNLAPGGGFQHNLECYGENSPSGTNLVESILSSSSQSIIFDSVSSVDVSLSVSGGNAGVYIRSIEIEGAEANQFSLQSGLLEDQLLTPNSNHTLSVAFTGAPNSAATLVINHGAFDELEIALSTSITSSDSPVAVIEASTVSGDAPLTIDFSGSNAGNGEIETFSWDFGDGGTASVENPSYTFNTPGDFTVTLTITTVDDATDSETISITAFDSTLPRIDHFTLVNADSNETLMQLNDGAEIDFQTIENTGLNIVADTSVDGIGSVFLSLNGPLSFARTEGVAPYALFGDVAGNFNPMLLPIGNYTVTATPYSGGSLSGIQGESFVVQFSVVDAPEPIAPIAIATATPLNGEAPLEVFFNGSSSSDDLGIVTYEWDFQDGGISLETNPTHIFTSPGTYEVELTVTDADNLQDTATITINVAAPPVPEPIAPIAIATATPLNGEAPLEVFFNGSSSSDDLGIVTYEWDFQDGGSSLETNPTHIFTSPGTYEVELIVTDADDLQDVATVTINVAAPPAPETDGVFSFTLIDADLDIDLFDLEEGMQINQADIPSTILDVRANTDPAIVGSVQLRITGPVTIVRTENVEPYALFGNLGPDYTGAFLPAGDYQIEAVSFSGGNLTGTPGIPFILNFSIVTPNFSASPAIIQDLNIYPNPADEFTSAVLSDPGTRILEALVYDMSGQLITNLTENEITYRNGELILTTERLGEGFYNLVVFTNDFQRLASKMIIRH